MRKATNRKFKDWDQGNRDKSIKKSVNELDNPNQSNKKVKQAQKQ